jgi:hypothetical protein
MWAPLDVRVHLAYFYVTAAYYASFCRLDGLRCVWILELAALAAAPERVDIGVGFATFGVGCWYMAQATHVGYRVAWSACQGAAMGIWVSETWAGGERMLFSYVARCMLNVLSHVAIMRGCGGATVWPA